MEKTIEFDVEGCGEQDVKLMQILFHTIKTDDPSLYKRLSTFFEKRSATGYEMQRLLEQVDNN